MPPTFPRWKLALLPLTFAIVGAIVGFGWIQGALAGAFLTGANLIGVDYLSRTNRDFDEGLGRNISLRHPYVWLAAFEIAGLMALLIWYLRLRSA